MPSSLHTIHQHQHHLGWDNTFAPALTVAPGTTVAFETVDASGAQLSPESTVADVPGLDFGKVNPVTGLTLPKSSPGTSATVESGPSWAPDASTVSNATVVPGATVSAGELALSQPK
jgi:amidase